jgi:hypothetical protein
MAAKTRRGLSKPVILTAAIILAAPIMSADAPAVATLCVYAALICCLAWWTRYFFKRANARSRANAVACDRALEAREARDFATAMQWFALAANGGDADAMNQIGLLHMNGLGVPQDYQIAAEWFQKAIAHGDTRNAPGNHRRALAEMQRDKWHHGGSSDDGGVRMTRGAALEVFDLKEGAMPADIRAAYLRLMQQVHPDRGGSNFFAKQLNEARDLLLSDRESDPRDAG